MRVSTEELGHGVAARPEPDGSWTVTSSRVDLGWQVRQGLVPGTAVSYRDDLFEVSGRERGEAGFSWRLTPWPEGETVRVVTLLDAARVAAAAATAADEARSRTIRRRLVAVLPLAGLLPRGVQERLQRAHNFPALLATEVSAAHEIGLGGLGVIQLVTAVMSSTAPTQVVRWLIVATPLLIGEGVVRLALAMSQGRPFGSLSTWPITWFERRQPPPDPGSGYRPTTLRCDPAAGVLELATARVRPDWGEDGVLRFRDQVYRLLDKKPGQGRMVYRFALVEPGTPPTLQLLPPPAAPPRGGAEPVLAWVTLPFRIVLMSFAPRELQERWFRARGTSPLVATAASAFTEAFGGVVNLVDRPAGGILTLVDLFFLVEGTVRLTLALARGHGVGSLLGRPFLPLCRRWAEQADPTP
jgi:hypothetical protein